VAKVMGRLAVSKKTMHRFYMERFNPRNLKKVEGREQYHVEMSNRFAALETLDAEMDINRSWETIREKVKISYEFKKHKPRFDEGYSELLDRRKLFKLQWLQNPSKINGDNLNNIRSEASRLFRNKRREYLKEKLTSW
jgi:hypothetical protein